MSLLEDSLVKRKLVTHEALSNLKFDRLEAKKCVHELLWEECKVDLNDIRQMFSEDFGICHSSLNEEEIDVLATGYFPQKTAIKYTAFPLKEESGTLIIALSDPTNIIIQDDIRAITGLNLKVVYSEKETILKCIEKYYTLDKTFSDLLKNDENTDKDIMSQSNLAGNAGIVNSFQNFNQNDSLIVQIINHIIYDAIVCRASDIHIEPQQNNIQIRYRIDGDLKFITQVPTAMKYGLVARVKIMCELDIAERRKPQDGGVKLNLEGRSVDLRISITPTFFGEKAVIRILDPKESKTSIESLGLAEKELNILKRSVAKAQGMILVTGPTGSGKTSTLYAALNHIMSEKINIITIEDPIEYLISGISQIQVNKKTDVTFANGLRSILRQDPNVILVGEIRDRETAEVAFRASMTGHLVLSTLHTNSSVATINRLTDIGLKSYIVASCITLIIAQRLVRTNCPSCKAPYVPSKNILNECQQLLKNGLAPIFYKGRGCKNCNGTGFIGRMAIFEFMRVTDRIRDLIAEDVPEAALLKEARKAGQATLLEAGMLKVAEGVTTIEEVLNKCDFSVDEAQDTSHSDEVSLYANIKNNSSLPYKEKIA